MKLDVYLDELDRSARCQSVLKIEFLPTLVKTFKPSKTHPPPRPPARHSNPEGPLEVEVSTKASEEGQKSEHLSPFLVT